MNIYALLDSNNVCIGFSELSNEVKSENYIKINIKDDDLIYRKYIDGVWSEEKYIPPEPEQKETLEEKIERLEQQRQQDTLTQLEVLATIYEEILMKG